MNIKEISKEIHNNNIEKGFWESKRNVGELLMLIVSELSEALEAHRKGDFAKKDAMAFMDSCQDESHLLQEHFPETIKDTFEDELADVAIRLFDMCEGLGVDLEWHIKQKVRYNKSRPYKHGKAY